MTEFKHLLSERDTPQFKKLLQDILETTMEVFKVKKGFIRIYEEDTQELVVKAYKGIPIEKLSEEILRRKSGVGKSWECIEAGKTFIITTPDPMLYFAEISGISLITPLASESKLIGTLSLFSPVRNYFDRYSPELFIYLGNQLGLALDKARLLQQVEQRNRELATLYDISQAVNTSLELDRILNDALDKVMELFHCHSTQIRLLDHQTQELVFAAQKGLNPEELQKVTKRLKIGESIAGLAIESQQAVIIEDMATDPRMKGRKSAGRKLGLRSMASLPLYGKDALLGNISIRYRERHRSTPEEIQLLTAIGHLIGAAIANAGLYREQSKMILELDETRAVLQTAMDQSQAGIAIANAPDGKLRYINKAGLLILGDAYETDRTGIGMKKFFSRWQFFDVDGKPLPANQLPLYRAVRYGEHCSRELTIRRTDHDDRILLANAAPIVNAAGKVMAGIVVFLDITKRKRTEEALKKNQDLFSDIINSTPSIILARDLEGKLILLNNALLDLYKLSKEQALGTTCYDVFPKNVADEIARRDREVMTTGESFQYEETMPTGDTPYNYITTKFPLRDAYGNIYGVSTVTTDITERKRAEENQSKLEQHIRQAQKLESLGVLAGGIAHDFNNLLGGIFGYIDLARLRSSDGLVVSYLDKALQAFNRATDLTKQLLTFSKGGDPVQQTGLLSPILKETVLFDLSGSAISCRFQLAEDLWLCDFDENQISQAVTNIIINAQQAMPQGGNILIAAENVTLPAGTSIALPEGRYIRVTIKDTGIGIPESILPRIFDPFFTTKQKGSGLGLAIVHSIISRHNGAVYVESEPGAGATFTIYLPASEKKASAKKSAAHAGSSPPKGGTVLVMDDEEFMRQILEEMLNLRGYDVVCAAEGMEALAIFAEHEKSGQSFAAVILDLTVPGGKGGREIIGEIRKLNARVPVISSSGYSEDPVMADPARFGFTVSITKPYKMENLEDVLNICIKKAALAQ